jgi:uncharacterized membrane protein YdjX (TVP38/TMEM64 family)
MRKGWIAVVAGLVLGSVISFFTLEYKGWTFIRHNSEGDVYQVINELDVNLVMNSFLIIAACGIGIYLILFYLEKFLKRN